VDYEKVCERKKDVTKMATFHEIVVDQLLLKAAYLLLSGVSGGGKDEDLQKDISSKVAPHWMVLHKLFMSIPGESFFSKLVRERVRASFVLVRLVSASVDEKPRHPCSKSIEE